MNDIRGLILCASCVFVVYAAPQDSGNFLPRDDERDDPTISTTHGYLRGQWLTSTHGRRFAAFKGVPYAAPPVGDLRFEPPREATPWKGVRNARKHGPQCPQLLFILDEYIGNEDCLYLNIYTPQRTSRKLLPILFFIHGGAWVLGAGDMDEYLYGPDHFMNEEVILVTINYRLGALGFLYLENTIFGNMGLKDQAMGLKWVKANAMNFGGDPNRIVAMGESAGAASAEYHTMNEASVSMISGAIAQSGSALGIWAWTRPEVLAMRTRRLAGLINCPNFASARSILRCLRKADAKELVRNQIFTNWSLFQIPIGVSFTPTTEPRGTPEAFLRDCPMNQLTRTTFAPRKSVPYLTGYNTAEGLWFARIDASLIDSALQNLVRLKFGLPRQPTTAKNLRRKPYLTQPGLTLTDQILGDYEFKAPVIRSSKMHAKAGADVYLYHFAFGGRKNLGKLFFGGDVPTHMDELLYLFQGRGLFDFVPHFDEPSPEAKVSARLIRMWTNFATTGNPTPTNETGVDFQWPRGPSQLLIIGEDLSIGKAESNHAWNNFINLQCVL